MGTNPRSAGFEPRASIFRGACAAPSGKDDDIEGMSIVQTRYRIEVHAAEAVSSPLSPTAMAV